MKIFKPRKYIWIGPILVVLSGILNLSNKGLSEILKLSWYILLPCALIVSIIGIVLHVKWSRENQ